MGSAIRIGVVGAGYWGPNLIRNCRELGVLHSVCDANPAALQAVRDQYPEVATTQSFDDLLGSSVDAVVIATPAQLHSSMTLAALAAGLHVFVEKPLALTVADGETVAAAAERAGLQVFVGHVLLYHPAVKRMRSLIDEGAIGDVWHVRSRRLSLGKLRAHENVWWSFAPHDVALVLALMKSEPLAAHGAHAHGRPSGTADLTYADFHFSGERSAHIEVCWLDPQKTARLDVFGSRGVATLEDSRAGSVLTITKCGPRTDQGHELEVWREDPLRVDVPAGEPLKAELLAFLAAIDQGHNAETDAREGLAVLRALAMVDAEKPAASAGRPLKVLHPVAAP
ncbi:MAG: oxidoreductase [Candidatus Eremiobacter antarcticus]|nr:Gfo/Idh/MocA family oxidoreductase [Candidatus Eremiobacteraeota bacterium]MBC5808421.1 Gfo/Idh/MocA family oxidoreductase [Candidatus Eremiobacteraeota bacterium]PZR63780.1 MAG: oxidoreductase [Candidatus Eremiobacter sp. RRmetagenome_bin22]